MLSGTKKSRGIITPFRVLFFICCLCAFALGIKSFREPDLWWQIRTGEWILTHGQVPKTDVFSFTFYGTRWINIKWGFEVIAALITRTLGASNIFLLQSVVNLLILFCLVKMTRAFRKRMDPDANEGIAFQFALIISILIMLVSTEYRMIGRPEMFSHLFAVIFLYLFIDSGNRLNRKIFLIIILQLVWANMHEAFGTGIVITAVFCFATFFDLIFFKKDPDRKKRAIWYTIILIASCLIIIINPNGTDLLLQPLKIFHQVYANKYTTEMLSFASSAFWKKESYIAIVMLGISTVFLIRRFIRLKNFKKADHGYLIVLLAFIFLASGAFRNIIFFTFISFPLFTVSIEWIFSPLFSDERKFRKIYYSLLGLTIIFYLMIVSNKYYEINSSHDRFGLEVLSIHNPAGAAKYIRAKDLQNKKCFSDYLSSSYLLYDLRPDFKTYIDLRDLDIFPDSFFADYMQRVNDPKKFFELDQRMHFDYVLLYRLQNQPLHTYLYNDSLYALTYLDANSAVYERTDSFTRSDIFTRSTNIEPGFVSDAINLILNPFYHHYDMSSINYDNLAGHYYMDVQQYDLASVHAENLLNKVDHRQEGLNLSAQIAYEKAIRSNDEAIKEKLFDESENYFLESIRMNKKDPISHFGLALDHFHLSKMDEALKELDRSLDLDPEQFSAHYAAAQINKQLYLNSPGDIQRAQQMIEHFEKADRISPGNPEIQFNIGLGYYYQRNCANASDNFLRALKNPSLDDDSRLLAKKYLNECSSQ